MSMFKITKKNVDDPYGDIDQNPYGESESDFGSYDTPTSDFAAPAAPQPVAPEPAHAATALKIVNPKSYQDAQDIAGYLLGGNTVLLNIENMAREQAIRLLDYLSGVTFAVSGVMTKVGKTTIVVAPKNVDVSSIEAMVGGN